MVDESNIMYAVEEKDRFTSIWDEIHEEEYQQALKEFPDTYGFDWATWERRSRKLRLSAFLDSLIHIYLPAVGIGLLWVAVDCGNNYS